MDFNGLAPYKIAIDWIPCFDGTKDSYLNLKSVCNRVFKLIKNCDYGNLLFAIIFKLEKSRVVLSGDYKTWEQLRDDLDDYFDIHQTEFTLHSELMELKKTHEETMCNFYHRTVIKYRDYCDVMQKRPNFNAISLQTMDQIILQKLIKSIDNTMIRFEVVRSKPKDIHVAYKIYREVEREYNKPRSSVVTSSDINLCLKAVNSTTNNLNYFDVVEVLDKFDPVVNNNSNVNCQYCYRKGHFFFQCFKFKKEIDRQGVRFNFGDVWSNMNCKRCCKQGHLDFQCHGANSRHSSIGSVSA